MHFFIAIVIKIDYNWENDLALTMTDQWVAVYEIMHWYDVDYGGLCASIP